MSANTETANTNEIHPTLVCRHRPRITMRAPIETRSGGPKISSPNIQNTPASIEQS